MSAKRAFPGLALAGLVLASSDAASQSSSELLTDPTPFEIGYGMSFYRYDACGDAELGRIFRRALLAKLHSCPFTPQALRDFEQWQITTLEQELSERLSAQNAPFLGPPEVSDPISNPDGKPMTCAEYQAMPWYVERRAALLRYSRREISAGQLMGEDCPSGPASL
jgi:hypothetical protein